MRVAFITFLLLLTAREASAAGQFCGEAFTTIEALEASVKAKAGVAVASSSDQVVSYFAQSESTYWNFSTPANAAHPSVACRKLVNTEGAYSVATEIRCGAAKAACDTLAETYAELDRQMRAAAEKKRQ